MQQEEINYNQYLIDNITHYLVTTFLGRGQYSKIEFQSLDKAKSYFKELKQNNPCSKSVLYGISQPKEKSYPINVMMES
tara:strand:- start:300 stop:536 length:237 start_codon:yes stop_codon:yes gene_type:complete